MLKPRLSAPASRAPRPAMSCYVPPGRKQKQEEWEKVKAELHRKLSEQEAAGPARRQQEPNIRSLARKHSPMLEQLGSCGFNSLLADAGIEIDSDGERAECTIQQRNCSASLHDEASPCVGPGLKALPLLHGGRYQFEVELMRPCALVVGFSTATSLPSCFDHGAFGYSSEGVLVHNHSIVGDEAYWPPFGSAGDVIGVLLDWQGRGPRISFMLNGRHLGLAFDLCADEDAGSQPPLQPHICQGLGPAFAARLLGTKRRSPLRCPARGYRALWESEEAHFCPFSVAVAKATPTSSARLPTVARRLIHGSLGTQLPLSHLAQERHAERRGATMRDAEIRKVSARSPPKFGGA
eukprot:gb/GFBE01000433.1/.p1 GENE.gb/GFBE01000433.1/~~gb/GFBE01000433.1/.p1  ORF type:complete len:351 (+),score=42.28 gb/GFBE01000433.1/:1-1053(+)